VTPTHPGCGTGTALVHEAIRQAQERGASEILLRANVKNEAAKNLFTQMGLELSRPMWCFTTLSALGRITSNRFLTLDVFLRQ
jgi:hypothetical protein